MRGIIAMRAVFCLIRRPISGHHCRIAPARGMV